MASQLKQLVKTSGIGDDGDEKKENDQLSFGFVIKSSYSPYDNFVGAGAILLAMNKYVPNKMDQILCVDLVRNARFEALHKYFESLKLEKSMFYQIEAIFCHVALSTYGSLNQQSKGIHSYIFSF